MHSMGRGTMRSMVEGSVRRRLELLARTGGVGASYPSTALRAVPLPIFDGEDRSAVAFVALAGLDLGLGVLPLVGGERGSDLHHVLELAFGIAADEALVVAGVDQLALALGHGCSPMISVRGQNQRDSGRFQGR